MLPTLLYLSPFHYSSGTLFEEGHERCFQGLEETGGYFLQHISSLLLLFLPHCNCRCCAYLCNFSGISTNCRSYSVSHFSDFVHHGVLVFDHHLTLDYHYICFRISICVPNHDEEQEPDQRQCMVSHIHISYPPPGDGVQPDCIRVAVVKGSFIGMGLKKNGVFE
ncbi:hypothetical protein V6N11_000680 [Hibiscus sabdariffa]|uniref:Uncharacterized protein n=1 Tax=Hibiscus sabdariffa TaxID=183260 RepID=A0ABR2RXP4_9ROSI